MSAGTTIASILLLCALVAAGVWLWLRQQHGLQLEAFQALAARRGWSLTISEQKLGRPAVLRLSARSGRGWHCVSRRDQGPDQGMPAYLTTQFVAEDPHWSDGHLILAPGAPDQSDPDIVTPDLPKGKSALSLKGRIDLARTDDTTLHYAPYPGPAGLAVLATNDPAHRFDLNAMASIIAEWPPHQSDVDGLPVIQISPEGFRMQVSYGMRRADQMEGFIDFALNLIRVI